MHPYIHPSIHARRLLGELNDDMLLSYVLIRGAGWGGGGSEFGIQ